jgi:hypothetical protein
MNEDDEIAGLAGPEDFDQYARAFRESLKKRS